MARSSNLKSDLKFMAKTTYIVPGWLGLLFGPNDGKKEEHLALLDLSASPQVKRKK